MRISIKATLSDEDEEPEVIAVFEYRQDGQNGDGAEMELVSVKADREQAPELVHTISNDDEDTLYLAAWRVAVKIEAALAEGLS
jgi:hypothetical protein